MQSRVLITQLKRLAIEIMLPTEITITHDNILKFLEYIFPLYEWHEVTSISRSEFALNMYEWMAENSCQEVDEAMKELHSPNTLFKKNDTVWAKRSYESVIMDTDGKGNWKVNNGNYQFWVHESDLKLMPQ